MIDLHCHLLPGIDDGPRELEGALALAEEAVASGTQVIAATPHVDHRHGVITDELAARRLELASELAAAGIPLEVVAGAELAPERALDIEAGELLAIALGESSCVLLECPFADTDALLHQAFEHLVRWDMRVLLAHPERSPVFLSRPARLADLVRRGALTQITASSLSGGFGRTVERLAWSMLDDGLVHVIASDAHDAFHRGPLRPEQLRMDPDLAHWLTTDVPAAVLADSTLPPRPPQRRRGWLSRIAGLS